jgi:hypothetical protein
VCVGSGKLNQSHFHSSSHTHPGTYFPWCKIYGELTKWENNFERNQDWRLLPFWNTYLFPRTYSIMLEWWRSTLLIPISR